MHDAGSTPKGFRGWWVQQPRLGKFAFVLSITISVLFVAALGISAVTDDTSEPGGEQPTDTSRGQLSVAELERAVEEMTGGLQDVSAYTVTTNVQCKMGDYELPYGSGRVENGAFHCTQTLSNDELGTTAEFVFRDIPRSANRNELRELLVTGMYDQDPSLQLCNVYPDTENC